MIDACGIPSLIVPVRGSGSVGTAVVVVAAALWSMLLWRLCAAFSVAVQAGLVERAPFVSGCVVDAVLAWLLLAPMALVARSFAHYSPVTLFTTVVAGDVSVVPPRRVSGS